METITEKETTLVLGASDNPERYSYKAVQRLKHKGYPVVAIGRKRGIVENVEIITEHPQIENIDTVTLYLNPANQKEYYDYILSLKPKRIIFNPGAENLELERLAAKEGINVLESCTLVMLSTGQY